MINSLRYEPQGQRQRFEPREQQGTERGERERHIHLHFHVHLTLPASLKGSMDHNTMRIARMCAALLAATVMPLVALILAFSIHDGPPIPLLSAGNLPLVLIFAGLALAWGLGGLPLLVSAWQANPHRRLRLFGPLVLLLGISLILLITLGLGVIPVALMSLVMPLLILVFLAQPFITALLLMWVSREARALRQTAGIHGKPGFVVVSGMALALPGVLLWYLSAILRGGMLLVAELPLILAAILVTIITFLASRKNKQAHPKDASPSEFDSPAKP